MTPQLLHGHKDFLSRYCQRERDYLQRLAHEGQRPGALYIGCSDSRVVPEVLTQAVPGELFVVRNIANLVPELAHPDASVGAAIEYAVVHLKIPNIIVCGHQGCGGVRAALAGTDGLTEEEASLREWLAGIAPVAGEVRRLGLEGDEALRWAVEENVLRQLDNLLTFPGVKRRLDRGDVTLHGWVYDLYALSLSVYDVETDRFVPATELSPP
jgi:carbonic anhydrase